LRQQPEDGGDKPFSIASILFEKKINAPKTKPSKIKLDEESMRI
jgi:hypothetical protein